MKSEKKINKTIYIEKKGKPAFREKKDRKHQLYY